MRVKPQPPGVSHVQPFNEATTLLLKDGSCDSLTPSTHRPLGLNIPHLPLLLLFDSIWSQKKAQTSETEVKAETLKTMAQMKRNNIKGLGFNPSQSRRHFFFFFLLLMTTLESNVTHLSHDIQSDDAPLQQLRRKSIYWQISEFKLNNGFKLRF